MIEMLNPINGKHVISIARIRSSDQIIRGEIYLCELGLKKVHPLYDNQWINYHAVPRNSLYRCAIIMVCA